MAVETPCTEAEWNLSKVIMWYMLGNKLWAEETEETHMGHIRRQLGIGKG